MCRGHEFSLNEMFPGESQKNTEVNVGIHMDCEWIKREGAWVSKLACAWIIHFGLLSVPARTSASSGNGQAVVEFVSPGFMVN